VREENKDAVLLREDLGETFLSSPSLAFEIGTRLSENINDVIAVMQLRARERKRQREREREGEERQLHE